MSNHAKPAPKHRGAPKHAHLARAPRKAARNAVVFSSVAVAVTGVSIAAGLAGQHVAPPAAASADLDPLARTSSDGAAAEGTTASATDQAAPRREAVLSRSDRRPESVPAKALDLSEARTAAMTDERKLSDSDPRDIARALLGEFGFSSDQFGCLDSLWTRESNWRVNADNPTSSAYGIPQALPGSKMSTEGADWATNPATQIRWGLGYIKNRYGSPCSAWGHSESVGWY
ncbi:lytic transglycosylase domain-containing protein [Pimelobacter simplex]|uniref:aggregation-promoting factor C-terminal-like domain-containing protein n=1 Tax=Nocardioides simplex TaxID=2045 RepID=UPI00214FC09D|nr:lytic transglycosylase domain-containing protein [Pimelobacter simplex]UUW92119.1 lytic transglycosylase domain-containing protein [Pimelobacter simplex]UUW95946.1 lytic transglycosylase domain-containing protein [Pimelobacter simplex]